MSYIFFGPNLQISECDSHIYMTWAIFTNILLKLISDVWIEILSYHRYFLKQFFLPCMQSFSEQN